MAAPPGSRHHARLARPVDCLLRRLEAAAAIKAVAAHTASVNALTFVGGSALLASADDSGSLRVWTLPAYTGAPRPRLRAVAAVQAHPAAVNSLSASDDGALLASAGDDGAVRLWDVAALPGAAEAAPVATLCAHDSFVSSVAFAPDAAAPLLCSADLAGGVCVWDARAAARPAATLRVAAPAATAALAPRCCGPLLLTAGAGGAQLWDMRAMRSAPPPPRLALAAQQNAAVWGPVSMDADAVNRSVDACAPAAPVQVYRCDDAASCAFREDTGRFEGRFHGHSAAAPLISAAFCAGGSAVITSAADGTHRLWCAASGAGRLVVADAADAAAQRRAAPQQPPPPPYAARPAVAAPPGPRAAMPLLLAGCPTGGARVWHLGAPPPPGGPLAGIAAAPPACRLRDHAVAVRAAALAPDGLALATADVAGSVIARRAGDAPCDASD